MIRKYFKLIKWYLERPSLYPELGRLIESKLARGLIHLDQSDEAIQWCYENAVSTQEAIQKITGIYNPQPIDEKFPAIFKRARKIVEACPIKLGGAGNLDLLYFVAEFIQAKMVVETGVAYGWSSLSLLLSLMNRKNIQLISTDMPCHGLDIKSQDLSSDAFVGCVVPEEYKKYWQIIRQADRDGLPKALRQLGTIDLCHYDSAKSYSARMWAYPLLWKSLRVGGFFISDDIGDNLAFRDFCIQINLKPIVVMVHSSAPSDSNSKGKYAGVITKLA